jgi:hypothetical protein
VRKGVVVLCGMIAFEIIKGHTCNYRLKWNTCFRLSFILLQHVSASLGHHHMYILLLKLLLSYLSVLLVDVLLLLILKGLKSLKNQTQSSWIRHFINF